MNTLAALIILDGYLLASRRRLREATAARDIGATTLELVILILVLAAVATALALVLRAAVQRRLDQIN